MERVQDNKQCSRVFEQLFKQHYRTLCFYAMSLVNDLDASKDIVHDVFLSLWNRDDLGISLDHGSILARYGRNPKWCGDEYARFGCGTANVETVE